jgi:hypothetical protein
MYETVMDRFVEWLARSRPDQYDFYLGCVHGLDVQPDTVGMEYGSEKERQWHEALHDAIRRRERAEARAGRPAACDEGGVWQRTSYGMDHGTTLVVSGG